LPLLCKWYGGYAFSRKAKETLFNSNMCLYFLGNVMTDGEIPEQIIDFNIKIDYKKLEYLLTVDRKGHKTPNGNFSTLSRIMTDGQIRCNLVDGFPVDRILESDNFVSLLYFMGLLSIDSESRGLTLLKIPNEVVRRVFYEYFRDELKSVDIFRLDINKFVLLLNDMAFEGNWQPLFEFLAENLKEQTSIRDYIHGEAMVKGFLLAYLNFTEYYTITSEGELNKGYCDLFLHPFLKRFPDMEYSYIIELKYVSQNAKASKLKTEVTEGRQQLKSYTKDRKAEFGDTEVKRLLVVFKGWDIAFTEEV